MAANTSHTRLVEPPTVQVAKKNLKPRVKVIWFFLYEIGFKWKGRSPNFLTKIGWVVHEQRNFFRPQPNLAI